MAEIVGGKRVFTLEELVGSVQRMFQKHYNGSYWVKTEISKLNLFTRTGHCYPELVENRDGKTVASVTAFIHKKNLATFNEKFMASVGEPIKDGMKVFVLCKADFTKCRGLRLNIIDIDIDSIIGEHARVRQMSILRLKSEGVFALNKNIPLPRIVKRLAVVSVETSKGYQDFCAIIRNTPQINVHLEPAQMIGNKAVAQIMDALTVISAHRDDFDAVCIIRGGGGEVALQCFNDIDLSRMVASFPIPVLAGIGHVTNKTVVEEVANMGFVSPSDLGTFLVDRFKAEAQRFGELSSKVVALLNRHIARNSNRLLSPSNGIKYKFRIAFERKYQQIRSHIGVIRQRFHNVFVVKSHAIFSKSSHLVLLISGHRQIHARILDEKIAKLQPVEHRNVAFKASPLPPMPKAAEPVDGLVIFGADGKVVDNLSSVQVGDVVRIKSPDGKFVTAKILSINQ